MSITLDGGVVINSLGKSRIVIAGQEVGHALIAVNILEHLQTMR